MRKPRVEGGKRGLKNSSKTRVNLFFTALRARDTTGTSWLGNLLSIVPSSHLLPAQLIREPGFITELAFGKEKLLPPPPEFLQWLIQNPQEMTWNDSKGDETQRWRKKLMCRQDLSNELPERHLDIKQSERKWTINDGLRQLRISGAAGHAKTLGFEGFTHVDCYIKTDQFSLYIEGKRTEKASTKTAWFPKRNQIVRNVEAARAHARSNFGCLVIDETKSNRPSESEVQDSLPHLSMQQRQELMRHYLGRITWREACEATDLDYEEVFSGHID